MTSESSVREFKTSYRTAEIKGVDIFYREAGIEDAFTILLLHGFPTSSHMYRNLIPALSDQFHVIAPDYPGFGHSAMPPRDQFAYTFEPLDPLYPGRVLLCCARPRSNLVIDV